MEMNIATIKIDEKVTPKTSAIRRGGKQKSGKPFPCYSNFLFVVNTKKNYKNATQEELINLEQNQFANIVKELSAKIESEYLIVEGSEKGLKDFNLPIEVTREEAFLRIDKIDVHYTLKVGPQTGFLHFYYIMHIKRRGLNTQIDQLKVKAEVDRMFECNSDIKSTVFRDAKCDIRAYLEKHQPI